MRAMNSIAHAAQALATKTTGKNSSGSNAAPQLGYSEKPTYNQAGYADAKPVDALDALAVDLKKRLSRKALWGSASSLIPLPLIDLAVDVALLSNMLNDIHQTFGLTPTQLEMLDTGKRHKTFAAIQFVGNRAIGQFVTAAVVKRLIAGAGIKLTAGQLTKAVPIAGQIASAALNYGTLRHIINTHIDDCVAVIKQARV